MFGRYGQRLVPHSVRPVVLFPQSWLVSLLSTPAGAGPQITILYIFIGAFKAWSDIPSLFSHCGLSHCPCPYTGWKEINVSGNI